MIKVIKEFKDKFDHSTIYKVGEVVKFEAEREKDLVERKLAELVEEAKEAKKPRKKK